MKRVAVLILAFGCVLIGACSAQDDAVEVCEGELLKTLRSPSTYRRVDSTVSPPEFEPKVWTVSIRYDADNAFGTPVRGGYFCAFKAGDDGGLPSKTALEGAALDARLDTIEAQAKGEAPDPSKLDVFPCCLTKKDKAAFVALWPSGKPAQK